jgi:arylsulfatase A
MKKLFLLVVMSAVFARGADKPNVLYILCDDLGFGDVQALNPKGKIKTPNVDRLAKEGMIFTDAHSGSSVCTPTRYGILTGRYSWRSHLQNGVLGGYSEPLIAQGRMTVPSMLREQGYTTACIGKWHLGLDWQRKSGGDEKIKKGEGGNIDYAKPFANGPVTLGFDSYFGISASLDMPPFVWLVNDRAEKIPTVEKKWLRSGPAAEDFDAADVLPRLTKETCDFLAKRKPSDKPFFVYLALASPHTPIVPTKEWQGKSGISPYADFVMQTDDAVGQILRALDESKLAENTLIVFTSDNGCSPAADIPALEKVGHDHAAGRRGHKADIWDGGHRVPFVVRWPAKVAAGTRNDDVICLTDLMATCAEITGAKIPDNAGEDSSSFLPALLGKPMKPAREAVIHHSIGGKFALRQGDWKLELCPGSGGWSSPKDDAAKKQGLPDVQLYNMKDDSAEAANKQADAAERIAAMTKLLEKYVADGRSTPGAPQKNDVAIDIWKRGKGAKVKDE